MGLPRSPMVKHIWTARLSIKFSLYPIGPSSDIIIPASLLWHSLLGFPSSSSASWHRSPRIRRLSVSCAVRLHKTVTSGPFQISAVSPAKTCRGSFFLPTSFHFRLDVVDASASMSSRWLGLCAAEWYTERTDNVEAVKMSTWKMKWLELL